MIIIACVLGAMLYVAYEFYLAMKCHKYMGEDGPCRDD
jgi:hypothetical protein